MLESQFFISAGPVRGIFDCQTTGWCVLTLPDDAPKPDLVSGLHTNASASILQVLRKGVQNLKRTSMGVFGAALSICKSKNRDMHPTVDEALTNRWGKSPKIGAMDILETKEQGFQADMADFVQMIQENCQRTKNIMKLLNLISCMQTTSEVMSERPANLHSDFMWKSTADVYNGFFALLTASAHAQSEAFVRSKCTANLAKLLLLTLKFQNHASTSFNVSATRTFRKTHQLGKDSSTGFEQAMPQDA
ncbi:hypothetical protein HDU77_006488 [Chytriomyces hyalinus]|nr:hypothetical protein HDU77_006488 [Chytriomyces hyalinus]